jgi:hypothetical protein
VAISFDGDNERSRLRVGHGQFFGHGPVIPVAKQRFPEFLRITSFYFALSKEELGSGLPEAEGSSGEHSPPWCVSLAETGNGIMAKRAAGKAPRRRTADLPRQIKTIKRALKRLWATYLGWKSEDRKAEQALVKKLRTLQRSLSKKRKKR